MHLYDIKLYKNYATPVNNAIMYWLNLYYIWV